MKEFHISEQHPDFERDEAENEEEAKDLVDNIIS